MEKLLVSLIRSYFSLSLFLNNLSYSFLVKNGVGSTPVSGSPIITIISLTSTETFRSSHRNPPWNDTNNCLTHAFTSTLRMKWDMCMSDDKPPLSSSLSHSIQTKWLGPSSISWKAIMYFSIANYGNFLRSWSTKVIFLRFGSMFLIIRTPFGTINATSGYLAFLANRILGASASLEKT